MKILFSFPVLLILMSNSFLAANTPADQPQEEDEQCIYLNLAPKKEDAASWFVGTLLPLETQDAMKKLQRKVTMALGSSFRMAHVKPNKLHVTLKYIGSVANKDAPRATGHMESLFEKISVPKLAFKPKHLMLLKSGFQSNKNAPRLLILEVETEQMHGLFNEVEDALSGLCQKDQRPYLAHITLGTFSYPKGGEKESAAIEERLANVDLGNDILDLGKLFVLGNPAEVKGDQQYTNPDDYQIIYSFKNK